MLTCAIGLNDGVGIDGAHLRYDSWDAQNSNLSHCTVGLVFGRCLCAGEGVFESALFVRKSVASVGFGVDVPDA